MKPINYMLALALGCIAPIIGTGICALHPELKHILGPASLASIVCSFWFVWRD